MMEHFDVLVVGAGLSGICAACYLQRESPGRSYAILEGREQMGGTWDLFRYPGIRSDSDMYTLGYSFKPWEGDNAIVDGGDILNYIKETARENGIDEKIRYGHSLKSASWSTEEAKWTLEIAHGPSKEPLQMSCQFLYMCSGYYNYKQGYTPDFQGTERFEGQIIHPQQWPADLDYTDKRIIVIGSGATAVTLAPVLAEKAAQVTMLQRSPTYIASRPARDPFVRVLKTILPAKAVSRLARWKNVLWSTYVYNASRRRPNQIKKILLHQLRKQVGPEVDVDTHFTPRYNPWDQRICLVPDGDLFKRIKEGRVSMVTDHIETFTEKGIQLRSGEVLEADLIVTATGLDLLFLGDVRLHIDGEELIPSQTISYKGLMFRDVPNLALASGYTNASWTLKCELSCAYVCRLLNLMAKKGHRQCTPRLNDETVEAVPFMALSAGYIERSIDKFPKLGSKAPWKLHQNYFLDLLSLEYGALEDQSLEFL